MLLKNLQDDKLLTHRNWDSRDLKRSSIPIPGSKARSILPKTALRDVCLPCSRKPQKKMWKFYQLSKEKKNEYL